MGGNLAINAAAGKNLSIIPHGQDAFPAQRREMGMKTFQSPFILMRI